MKTKLESSARISKDKKQIILKIPEGISLQFWKKLGHDKDQYSQLDLSFQIPPKDGKKQLNEKVIDAILLLNGEEKKPHIIKSITLIINTKRKLVKRQSYTGVKQ